MENQKLPEISEAADLIVAHEGFSNRPYKCPAGKWTIGFGRRIAQGPNTPPTSEEKEKGWLVTELIRLKRVLTKIWSGFAKLPPHEKAALLSLVYNIGVGAFRASTLLKHLKAGKPKPEIEKQWLRWVFAAGKKLKGLVKRRKAEWDWYRGKIKKPLGNNRKASVDA